MPIVKKGGGRTKVVKVKQETLPTPQGRRVVPRITSAMKAEANKKAVLRKGGKKVKVCLSFFFAYRVILGKKESLLCCRKYYT